jgi:hypothetical protein
MGPEAFLQGVVTMSDWEVQSKWSGLFQPVDYARLLAIQVKSSIDRAGSGIDALADAMLKKKAAELQGKTADRRLQDMQKELAGLRQQAQQIESAVGERNRAIMQLRDARSSGFQQTIETFDTEIEALQAKREAVQRNIDRWQSDIEVAKYSQDDAFRVGNELGKKELLNEVQQIIEDFHADVEKLIRAKGTKYAAARIVEAKVSLPTYQLVHVPPPPAPPERFIEASPEIKELFFEPSEPTAALT